MVSAKTRYIFLILICCIVYVMSYFYRASPTILSLDLMRDFSLNAANLGVFSSATMLAYGIMQLPSGMLADIFGARNTLFALTLSAAIGTIWFAHTHSLETVFASRFTVGLGLAVTVPIAALLARWSPAASFARVISSVYATGGVGGILAAPPLTFLSNAYGWRATMLGFGIFSLALAALVFAFIKDSPGDNLNRSRSKPDMRGLFSGLANIARTRSFWYVCLWFMFTVGANFCMATLWWGPYFMQGCGMSKISASYVLTWSSLGIVVGGPLLGYMSDVVIGRRKPLLLACSVLSILALFCLAVFGRDLHIAIVCIATAIFCACTGASGALAFTLAKETFSPLLTGTAIGLMNMTFPIWSAVLQFMYGNFYTWHTGLYNNPEKAHSMALVLLGVNCLVGMFFLLPFKETTSQRPVSEEQQMLYQKQAEQKERE